MKENPSFNRGGTTSPPWGACHNDRAMKRFLVRGDMNLARGVFWNCRRFVVKNGNFDSKLARKIHRISGDFGTCCEIQLPSNGAGFLLLPWSVQVKESAVQ